MVASQVAQSTALLLKLGLYVSQLPNIRPTIWYWRTLGGGKWQVLR